MGKGQLVTIHHTPSIPWHVKRLPDFMEGLRKLDYTPNPTTRRERIDDNPAVLFGTSGFKAVEDAPGDWLLVDRASYGDPDFVTLGWNGRGSLGMYPDIDDGGERFRSHDIELEPMREDDGLVVVCGDADSTPLPEPSDLDWYFRPHPATGYNPTKLPVLKTLDGVAVAIVGASSIAIECLRLGIHCWMTDKDNMAYSAHVWGDRVKFFHWLAWTQYTWDEIRNGDIGHVLWLRLKDSEKSASN
jgi:hypothetical protein